MLQIAFDTVISFARPSGSGRLGLGAAKLRTSAIASLALALASWKACKYIFVVVEMAEWPNALETVATSTPSLISELA